MYRLGIDIGGTFTDLVLLNESSGHLFLGKTLTTYPDPSEGIVAGINELLPRVNVEMGAVGDIVHGTTLVTNALIERKGAETAFITTKGFRDVLEIGRELRYDIYDIFLSVPDPIVPRNRRYEVAERIDKSGQILTPLDEEAIVEIARSFVVQGIEAVGVCYLHAFMNPAHEQRTAELIRQQAPEVKISLSSEVLPEIREYERSVATAMNAYVQPAAEKYLTSLEQQLAAIGFTGTLHIMVSSGRLTTVEGARQKPILLLESGPAGGSMAGVFYGRLVNLRDLVTFDMGGTTAKASTILDGKPEIATDFEVARVRRFKKGSGLPIRIPVIDMIEIGAGGGSIAHLDNMGLLRVGPYSAGSQPGPVCYGLGGENPTVTDADLILGYLDPEYFLGGEMVLNLERTKQVLQEKIAGPLGIDVVEAALGIHRVVNENMANAARVHILEKGLDPRRFSLMAFGGAGPVHAFQVARLLKAPRLIVPLGAGVMSALGFLVSPIAVEHTRSYLSQLDVMDWGVVNGFLADMENLGRAFLHNAGVANQDIQVSRIADMRYSGQGHEITVPIPMEALGANGTVETIQQNFNDAYEQLYSRFLPGVAIESVSWRVIVSGPVPEINFAVDAGISAGDALKGHRKVYFAELQAYIDCPVYDRYLLRPGASLDGPAIIEERESTLVVGPASQINIDQHLHAIVNLEY